MNPQSESNYRGTGCGKAARPDLKGSGEATNRSTWKTTSKAVLTILILVLAVSMRAQYSGASVGYAKITRGMNSEFLELEKVAKKLHQARVERGIITQWHLYRKMYRGADDPYDYIFVSFYDDYMKTQNSFPAEIREKVMTEEEWAAFIEKARKVRTIIKNEYYDQVMAVEEGKPVKYIRINRYRVKPGEVGTYIDLRREITKPIQEELIKRDLMTGWSMWRKITYDREYQFVTVDAFSEFGQWKSDVSYPEVLKEVHPNLNQEETMQKLTESRMLVNSEYWRLVEFTDPAEE